MSGLKTVFKKSITKKVRSWEINTQKRKANKKKIKKKSPKLVLKNSQYFKTM